MSSLWNEAQQRSFAGRPRHGSRRRSLWGSLEVSDPASARRSGMTRYRLEVLPPGTNSVERRQWERARAWRTWGAVVGLVVGFMVEGIRPEWQIPLYIAVVYVGVMIFEFHQTRRLRQAIRRIAVATISFGGSRYVEGDLGLLEGCADQLERLDAGYRDGLLTPLDYELGWADVYELLAPRPTHK